MIGGEKPNEAWHHLQDDNATVVSAESVTGRSSEVSGRIDTTVEDPMRISHMDLINDFSSDTGGRFYDQVRALMYDLFLRTTAVPKLLAFYFLLFTAMKRLVLSFK